ncbi:MULTISPECIES: permease prefix domain 1-containing protein [unclassified Microbacterium]|uniref:permease prefix domain 1-containing protein n=1 Tax=unclassified Microbacterium TaxID=2609290 RepID=UPI00214AC01D|nr:MULTISPECIES: permease prefix domain 1-containing protein [unclassified Microbacterium]MCR2810826.1 permease prefix domain 1-containing protein [Microbacterium sp. zg.B185]WIM19768.1 permease prefix domain 1-containing protein [Microbacterium sp. zg-B185]
MTITATLTDRYVATAMRTVPESQRADLAAELRASIDDQIEARVADGAALEVAERAVLTELGDPDTLAAGYTDRPLWLIGPRYYLTWWRLTKLLWAIVPACAAFGVGLGQVFSGAQVGEGIGAVVSVALSAIVHIGFWTTLIFFIVERSTPDRGAGLVGTWSVDDLPELKENGAKLGDLIGSLVFLALAAGAVVWDHFVGFAYFAAAGEWMPFLAPSLWPWWITALFALIVLEALLAIFVYARGRWTRATATVNAALNVAIAIPALWLLLLGELVNPEFFAQLMPSDAAQTAETVVTVLIGFGIVLIAVWDTIDAFLKARRAR